MANSSATEYGDDCVLMLQMDGSDASTTFTDVSDTPHTITPNGAAQIDTAQSVFGGASALFDGSGDYLTAPDSADWDFGTGDFTIDLRVRFSSLGSDRYLISLGNYSDGIAMHYLNANTLRVWTVNSFTDFTWSISTNTWYHVALTRSGTDLRAFSNGTQIGTTQTNSANITGSTAGLYVGSRVDGSDQFAGWIDELRIVKGQAIWTSNFTSPTSAYVADGTGSGGGLAVLGRRPIRSHYRGVLR